MIKAKRCSKCGKVIRQENKSGLCEHCYGNKISMDSRRKKCHICKEECSGKNLIVYKKDSIISVCKKHWLYLNDPMRNFKNMKELREEISLLKALH